MSAINLFPAGGGGEGSNVSANEKLTWNNKLDPPKVSSEGILKINKDNTVESIESINDDLINITTQSFSGNLKNSAINSIKDLLTTIDGLNMSFDGLLENNKIKENLLPTSTITTLNNHIDSLTNVAGVTTQTNIPEKVVVFVDDDGHQDFYNKLAPVFDKYNCKATTAMITSRIDDADKRYPGYMSTEQLLDLNKRGFEIASHTKDHLQLGKLTSEAQVEEQLRDAYLTLKEMGLEPYSFVYPGGSENELACRLTRKYYKCARISAGNTWNTMPIETVRLRAFFIDTVGLADIKTKVDDFLASTDSGALIISTHCYQEPWTDEKYAEFDEAVKYITEKENIKVMTLKEMHQIFKNLIDIGDTTVRKYFKLGANGELKTNCILPYTILDLNKFNFDTPVGDYPIGMSIMPINNQNTTVWAENRKVGVVITFNPESKNHDFSFQLFHPYDRDYSYKRRWNWSTQVWRDFKGVDKKNIFKIAVETPELKPNEAFVYTFNNENITLDTVLTGSVAGGWRDLQLHFTLRVVEAGKGRIIIKNISSDTVTASTYRFNIDAKLPN